MPNRRRAADRMASTGPTREGFFLGNSPDPEKWRLFLTRDRTRYLEFRKTDTADTHRLATGRIVVVLRDGAEVSEGTAEPTPSRFLRGDFLASLRAASGGTLRRLLLSEAGQCGSGSGGGGGGDGGTIAPTITCPKPQCNDSIKDPGCK